MTAAGVYTAGAVAGVSDIIVVTDSDSPVATCAVPATIGVVAAVTNVDYETTSDTFPASALAGSTITGSFTIMNSGSADGSKPVSWWLFVSDDGSFDGNGEILVASNSTGFLTAGGSAPVTPTGNWPTMTGTYTVFVMISAEDDLTHGNNIYDAGTIALNVPDVDYRVVQVEHTGGGEKVPGQPFTGRFQYANNGPLAAADGLGTLSWEAYVSLQDAVLEAGDSRVAFGTGLSAMDAGDPPSGWTNFSGTWSLRYGDYFLIVKVSSPDNEMDTSNDQGASPSVQVGVYTEVGPNDNWTVLPGGGNYNILTGASPPNPIALQPGMSIKIHGNNISNSDRDDVFLFNTGTANSITFTVTWATDEDDIDLFVWRTPGDFPNNLIQALGYAPNSLSASITKGALLAQFSANEDLWFDVYCHIPDGTAPPLTHTDVGAYDIVISAQ